MNGEFRKQTILIVDDAKSNISILSELLRVDYYVRATTSGKRALEIARSDTPPDLILLDIMMPELDGYEVCTRLKASSQTKNIPIIFITGKTREEDEILGFNMGAIDYITKPFNPILVKARVNTHADLKRHKDYLEEISYLDGLTGISNRRKYNEYLELMWHYASREMEPIAIILIDVDHFKSFNDAYGHLQGDIALITIAQILSEVVQRKTDLVARYGGEEFVCVLPHTGLDRAINLAEHLRQAVMALKISHGFSDVEKYVTISLGVASLIPKREMSCCDLTKLADEALYLAKDTGRNKVSFKL